MAGPSKDSRKGRKEVLLIIPSYHDSFRLKKQLARLRRQSFRNFDVAIILAGDDKFVRVPGLTALQVKRKMDFGFAGSVCLGQLLALRDGYKYYMFTDVDRVPHGRRALAELFSEAARTGADFTYANKMTKGYFFPSAGFFDYENPSIDPSNCVFSLIRTSTLEKSGLYALPLYIGYEDVEFGYRVRLASRMNAHLDRVAYECYNSPAKNSFLRNFSRESFGSMYLYPTMICMFHSPQTASHMGFFDQWKMFFLVMLAQKFSALRVPALAELECRARLRKFGRVSGSKVSEDVSVLRIGRAMEQDYSTYSANSTVSNLAWIISQAVRPSKDYPISNYSPLFNFFMPDSLLIYDEGKRRTLEFAWKRRTSLPARLLALALSAWEATLATARSAALSAAGDAGIFGGYGMKAGKQ